MPEAGAQFADVDPEELAKTLANVSDEQLAEGMRSENRKSILDEIFRRMEEHFDTSKASTTEAVIHWKITGGAGGAEDVYEVVIRGGACKVTSEPSETARTTFTMDGVDFLRLVTGNVAGPALFMTGKLKIEGDLIFAAQAQSLFKVPQAAG